LNFLFKINSGFSGPGGRFTPSRIAERLINGKYLDLGWKRYLDAVDKGDSVWIYFKGPQDYIPGVYAMGRVAAIDRATRHVRVRITIWRDTAPLTDRATTARVAAEVARWYEQVFVMPDHWQTAAGCSVNAGAASCAEHRCSWCETWNSLPVIKQGDVGWPQRLGSIPSTFAPAYWVIPPRAYLRHDQVRAGIRHTTDLFKSFKAGNRNLSHPFALGIHEALRVRDVGLEFDAIVPIPLTPDKAASGEIHRTRLLASELSQILDSPVVEALSLKSPISKRALLSMGYTVAQFEARYDAALVVDRGIPSGGRVLLVDDVCTKGSTLARASAAIRSISTCEIVVATAGQMILRHVVRSEKRIKHRAALPAA
jgi:hypothetical protein